jgi:hypothetical protein
VPCRPEDLLAQERQTNILWSRAGPAGR